MKQRRSFLSRREYLLLSGAGVTALAGCSEGGEISLPATFEISGVSTPDNVTVGERMTLEANITNAGGEAGTVTVVFERDGSVLKRTEREVQPDGSVTVPLEHQPKSAGEWSIVIEAGDASRTVTIPVQLSTEAAFEITDSVMPSEVVAGKPFVLRATVRNTGSGSGTAAVALQANGETVSEKEVALEAGAKKTVRFTHSESESGSLPVEIVAGESTTSGTITVTAPQDASYDLGSLDAPLNSLSGRSTSIDAEVTNVGDRQGTATAVLTVDGSEVASEEVTVDAGASASVSFSHTFESAGEYTVSVAVGGATASQTVTVEKPAPGAFSLTEFSGPSQATASVTVRVSATVANTGQTKQTKQVQLVVGGEVVDSTGLTLAPGAESSVTLAWNPQQQGTFEYSLATPDDARTATVEVTPADGPATAADKARGRLLTVGESIITKIESEFVGQQGTMVASSWEALQTDLQWVSDKLQEAEGGLQESTATETSTDTTAIETRIERLRAAREALSALGESTGAGSSTYILYASLRSSLDDEPSMSAMDTYRQYLDQGQSGLANAQKSLTTAQSRLDAIDSGWLAEFNATLAPATTLSQARDDFVTALETLEKQYNTVRLDVASVAFDDARIHLITAASTAHTQIQDEFLTRPREGVDVQTAQLTDELEKAQTSIATAETILEPATTKESDLSARQTNLEHAHTGLTQLAKSLSDGAVAFNDATAAIAYTSVDSFEKSVSLVQNASQTLAYATKHLGQANDAFAGLSAEWRSGFNEEIDASIDEMLTPFDQALSAADILISGVNRLLDMGSPLSEAQSAYENKNFSTAASSFDDTSAIASDAHDILTDRPDDLPTDLAVMLDTAACRASHLSTAMSLFKESAQLAAEGKKEEAQERSDEAYVEAKKTCT